MQTSPNVTLHMVELAYGDRPFEIVDPDTNPLDVPLRTFQQELFFKENLLKKGVQSFPPGWKYGMICDADFHFTRHDWALETIHQLQTYAFVQPFSSYADVSGWVYGQAQVPVRYNSGFFFNYIQNGYKVSPNYHNGAVGAVQSQPGVGPRYDYESAMIPGKEAFMRGVGATGGALAFTREAYDAVGPFPDRCILGHCDWYVAFSLVGVEPQIYTVRSIIRITSPTSILGETRRSPYVAMLATPTAMQFISGMVQRAAARIPVATLSSPITSTTHTRTCSRTGKEFCSLIHARWNSGRHSRIT